MVQAIEKSRSLPELARLIEESHASVLEEQRAIIVGVSNCLSAKRLVGEYLLQAKLQVRHGQWLAWLRENCPSIEERTAQNYMLIAKEWDSLNEKLKSVNENENISDLGVVAALRLIKGVDEVVDAELVEDNSIDNAIVPARTPIPAQELPKATEKAYEPIVGDIAKVIDSKAGKFYGLYVKIVEIQSDVIVIFETLDKGDKSCLLSQQLELVERLALGESLPAPTAAKGSVSDGVVVGATRNQEEATDLRIPVSSRHAGNNTSHKITDDKKPTSVAPNLLPNAQATLQHILNAVTLPDDLARDILQQLVDYVNLPEALMSEAMDLLEVV